MAPPSRQERLQMRQRGAGARKVNNIDFGLSFGLTPGRFQRSVKRPSRPSPASLRRSSKTPSRNERQSSAQRSERSVSGPVETGENVANESVYFFEDRETTMEEPAAKRRRTNDGHNPERATPVDQLRSTPGPPPTISNSPPSRNSNSRRRTSGPAFVQIAEDPEDEFVSNQLEQSSGASIEPAEHTLQTESEMVTGDKENAVPAEEIDMNDSVIIEKPKSRKRISIGQQSGRRKKRPSGLTFQSVNEDIIPEDTLARQIEEEPEWETIVANESSLIAEEIAKVPRPSSPPSKKRRKRKSIVLKPKKRRRSGELGHQSVISPAELQRHGNAHVQDTIEPIVLASPSPKVQIPRTRRRVSDASSIQTPGNGLTYETEIEGDETYIDEEMSPERPTPKAPSKRAKTKARKGRRSGSTVQDSTSNQAEPSSRLKKSSKATFPILTHRLTNICALPTINEEAEAKAEDEIETPIDLDSVKTKFIDRPVPNAIDVLAQICRETISTTISKLSTSSITASTRGLKGKRLAIEAFGAEIDSRLFDMSVAIEHRLTMETRVKQARKAKTDAHNEWLEMRRRREDIALKCDDVRAQNSRTEAEGRGTYELSERLYELEMVVDRPELDRDSGAGDGLEYMLKSVATSVSCIAGDGGGLLDRVKDYNRQLERTALVLEGRRLD